MHRLRCSLFYKTTIPTSSDEEESSKSLTKRCPLQSALPVPWHRAEGDVLDALTVPLVLAENENDYEQHVQLTGRLV